MRLLSHCFVAPLLAVALVAPAAASPRPCTQKIEELTEQIELANVHGNTRQRHGLETALAQVQAHCTDAAQARDAGDDVRRARAEVREVAQDVQEAEGKLRQARADGGRQEIEKAERKLLEKQRKLRDRQEALQAAQASMAALAG